MIDQYFIKIFKPFLELVASPFYKFGVNANYISLLGLSLSFLSFYLILKDLNNIALFVFLLGRILDGVDGIIANKTRITEFGGFIDIVFDLISYSLVPLAFILNDNSMYNPPSFEPLDPPPIGIQYHIGPFDVYPNTEREFLYHVPSLDSDYYVNRVEMSMSQGTHHFILYKFSDVKKN